MVNICDCIWQPVFVKHILNISSCCSMIFQSLLIICLIGNYIETIQEMNKNCSASLLKRYSQANPVHIIISSGWSYQQSCSASCDLVGNYCYIVSSSTMDNAQSQSFCTSIGGQLPFFAVASDLTDYNNYK